MLSVLLLLLSAVVAVVVVVVVVVAAMAAAAGAGKEAGTSCTVTRVLDRYRRTDCNYDDGLLLRETMRSDNGSPYKRSVFFAFVERHEKLLRTEHKIVRKPTMYLHQVGTKHDESIARHYPEKNLVRWDDDRFEQLVLKLARTGDPRIARTYYALTDKRAEREQYAILLVLYEYGGLYVRQDGVSLRSLPFDDASEVTMSSGDGQWVYVPHAKNPALASALQAYVERAGRSPRTPWQYLQEQFGVHTSSDGDEDHRMFKFGNTGGIWSLLSKEVNSTTQTSWWNQIATGALALVVITAILFALYRYFEPNKIAQRAFGGVQSWVQQRLRGWDKRLLDK